MGLPKGPGSLGLVLVCPTGLGMGVGVSFLVVCPNGSGRVRF